jgi:hypothetical protein
MPRRHPRSIHGPRMVATAAALRGTMLECLSFTKMPPSQENVIISPDLLFLNTSLAAGLYFGGYCGTLTHLSLLLAQTKHSLLAPEKKPRR